MRFDVAGKPIGVGARVVCAALFAWLAVGCDRDPSGPVIRPPVLTIMTPDTIARQGAITVVFDQPVSPQTALDPANFVVTDSCTGLRIPGSLRLSGDTLIFSPSQSFAFLTRINVRVQNILGTNGIALAEPVSFTRTTERPPVSDISWALLDSPTNDNVTAVSFPNSTIGYIVTSGGGVYRTTNGGINFQARFKNVDIASTQSLRAASVDSLYMVGAFLAGGVVRNALFRSINGGLTFDTVLTTPEFMSALSFARTASNGGVLLMAGQFGSSAVYRYDLVTKVLTKATGIPTNPDFIPVDASLSPGATNALVAVFGTGSVAGQGFGYRSIDGGRTFTQLVLPSGVFSLLGSGFINATDGLLLGDSSVVLRVNTATGAVTKLGAAQGIPQAVNDPTTNTTTTFSFKRASFAPGGQLGFIIGRSTRRRTGQSNVVNGVILISRDGGLTWQRQAVQGASNNGLDFASLNDVQALSTEFSAVSGTSGFLAARRGNPTVVGGACSFSRP